MYEGDNSFSILISIDNGRQFLNWFSYLKIGVCWFKVNQNMYLGIQLIINQHWYWDGDTPWTSYQIRNIAGCICQECLERFLGHRLQRKLFVSGPGMHRGTNVTHVPWCLSGSLTRVGGENVPGIRGACATHNVMYIVRGPLYQRWWPNLLTYICTTQSHVVYMYTEEIALFCSTILHRIATKEHTLFSEIHQFLSIRLRIQHFAIGVKWPAIMS